MPNSFLSEIYFVALMMILTVILSVAATYIFIRQYKREKKNSQKTNEPNKAEKDYVQK